ncbi:MAG TPA: hypothetical protein VN628_12890 [Vicinamibacterales bacterium]|nr:hypothetical protein [Vicinamibacterales bacterium]
MNAKPSRGPVLIAVVAVLVLGGLSAWLQAARDRMPLTTTPDATLYLSQRATGRVVFTHRALAADLYWIRAIQYFGSHTQAGRSGSRADFDLLYPLLDITTTLDPRFNIAYRFGAIFLSEPYPHGPGRADLAIALLKKGVEAQPERWEYWEDIGFVYYWTLRDYRKASDAFQHGADVKGAPWWMRSLAATMLVRGGDRNTSRLLWTQLYETANNEYARSAALNKLMQLQAIEDIERLQAAFDRGLLRGLPSDPTGKPYVVNGSRVELSPDSPLNPLPIEPGTKTSP